MKKSSDHRSAPVTVEGEGWKISPFGATEFPASSIPSSGSSRLFRKSSGESFRSLGAGFPSLRQISSPGSTESGHIP